MPKQPDPPDAGDTPDRQPNPDETAQLDALAQPIKMVVLMKMDHATVTRQHRWTGPAGEGQYVPSLRMQFNVPSDGAIGGDGVEGGMTLHVRDERLIERLMARYLATTLRVDPPSKQWREVERQNNGCMFRVTIETLAPDLSDVND